MKKLPGTLIKKLAVCRLLVMDFDGVLTDNKVYTTSDGKELVRCDRSDSLGLEMLQKLTSVKALILSKEKNPVVRQRAKKLRLPVLSGIDEKLAVLMREIKRRHLELKEVCYIGNDINDLACMNAVGLAVAVKKPHPKLMAVADFVTEKEGGNGAVREICDLIIQNFKH